MRRAPPPPPEFPTARFPYLPLAILLASIPLAIAIVATALYLATITLQYGISEVITASWAERQELFDFLTSYSVILLTAIPVMMLGPPLRWMIDQLERGDCRRRFWQWLMAHDEIVSMLTAGLLALILLTVVLLLEPEARAARPGTGAEDAPPHRQ